MNKKSYLNLFFFFNCFLYAGNGLVLPDSVRIYDKIPRDNSQRKSSYPFISGDTFRSICDHIIDETKIPFSPDKVKDGDIIFVNTHALEYFFCVCHPLIKSRYILITHNSQFSVPRVFEKYLNDEKMIAWFGQNVEIKHPKLFPIPLGIANSYWPHGNINIISKIMSEPPKIKNKLLYMNFALGTHKERRIVNQIFKNKSFCTIAGRKPWDAYLKDLTSSKFVLSPRGAGIDCHRTWEALLMGSIPIVASSPIDDLFYDLPVLIIEKWEDITETFLLTKYEEISKKDYNFEKLYAGYWLDKIRAYKIKNLVS